jgi:hypothetical protein
MIHVMLFPMINVLRFYIRSIRTVCAVFTVVVFGSFLVSSFPGLLLTCSMNDFEYQFCLYILQTPHFSFKVIIFLDLLGFFLGQICLFKLQHLLTYTFLFHYHGLLCPVYCYCSVGLHF